MPHCGAAHPADTSPRAGLDATEPDARILADASADGLLIFDVIGISPGQPDGPFVVCPAAPPNPGTPCPVLTEVCEYGTAWLLGCNPL